MIYLIRHGEVSGNKDFAFVGRSDLGLNTRGREETLRLHQHLSDVEGAMKAFCSPAIRAQETAELALKGAAVTTKKELREIDFGDWEGKVFDEVSRQYSELVQEWVEDEEGFCFPNGECIKNFRSRVIRCAESLVQGEEKNIFIFSHGGVIRSLICFFLGLPLSQHLLFQVGTASISIVEWSDGRGSLKQLNIKPNRLLK